MIIKMLVVVVVYVVSKASVQKLATIIVTRYRIAQKFDSGKL